MYIVFLRKSYDNCFLTIFQSRNRAIRFLTEPTHRADPSSFIVSKKFNILFAVRQLDRIVITIRTHLFFSGHLHPGEGRHPVQARISFPGATAVGKRLFSRRKRGVSPTAKRSSRWALMRCWGPQYQSRPPRARSEDSTWPPFIIKAHWTVYF